jgi:hypothetical protein
MTRCLDCGSDRIADQCPACGLTSAAAELVVRRRLVKRTAFFLVGIIVFVAASQVFPALELDSIQIFGGIVFFLSLARGYWIDYRGHEADLFRHDSRALDFRGASFSEREAGHFAPHSRSRNRRRKSCHRRVSAQPAPDCHFLAHGAAL